MKMRRNLSERYINSFTGYEEWAFLIFIVFIASWLRLHDLGSLGFFGDEETTALAVQGVLLDGYPHMPSGMKYRRAIPYSYLSGAAAYFFGMDEFSIRLPSAIFGILTIPLLYIFVRRLYGPFPAIVTSFLLTFSSWHIIFSRMGRMYVMFVFFFVLSCFFLYFGFINGKRRFQFHAFFAGLLTLTLHKLGLLLILVWSLPLLLKNVFRSKNRQWLVGSCMGLIVFWIGYHRIINVGPSQQYTQTILKESGLNVLSGFQQMLHLKFTPKFWEISHLVENFGELFVGVTIGLMGLTFWIWRRYGGPSSLSYPFFGFTIGVLMLGVLNLFGLVMVVCAIVVFFVRSDIKTLLKHKYVKFCLMLLGSILLFWFAYGFLVWRGEEFGPISDLVLMRKVIKDSFYYPALHIMVFFIAFPIMTGIVIAGSIWWFLRYIKNGTIGKEDLFIILGFWGPLFVLGLTREWIGLRFVMPLYIFYLIIFARTLEQGIIWIREKMENSKFSNMGQMLFEHKLLLVIVLLMLGFLPVLNEHHGIREAFGTSSITYGQPISPIINSSFPFRPDHKGAGEYVKEHLNPDDLVIAMDVIEQYYYVGKADYWLREVRDAMAYSYKRDEVYYDVYTNSKILTTFKELQSLLNQKRTYRIWIITSGELTGKGTQFIPEGISEFLSKSKNLVYTGRDNETRVYLF